MMSMALLLTWTSDKTTSYSSSIFSHITRACSLRFTSQPITQSNLIFQDSPRCSSALSSHSSCPWPLLKLRHGTSPVLARQISPVRSIPNTRPRSFQQSVETEMDISLELETGARPAAHLREPSVPMSGSAKETADYICNLGRHGWRHWIWQLFVLCPYLKAAGIIWANTMQSVVQNWFI